MSGLLLIVRNPWKISRYLRLVNFHISPEHKTSLLLYTLHYEQFTVQWLVEIKAFSLFRSIWQAVANYKLFYKLTISLPPTVATTTKRNCWRFYSAAKDFARISRDAHARKSQQLSQNKVNFFSYPQLIARYPSQWNRLTPPLPVLLVAWRLWMALTRMGRAYYVLTVNAGSIISVTPLPCRMSYLKNLLTPQGSK